MLDLDPFGSAAGAGKGVPLVPKAQRAFGKKAAQVERRLYKQNWVNRGEPCAAGAAPAAGRFATESPFLWRLHQGWD